MREVMSFLSQCKKFTFKDLFCNCINLWITFSMVFLTPGGSERGVSVAVFLCVRVMLRVESCRKLKLVSFS